MKQNDCGNRTKHHSSVADYYHNSSTSQHKPRKINLLRRGSMLIEMTVAMAVLSAIGVIVLKGSIDLMAPRQWTIIQNISDAYISYEQAYAERVSFEELTDDNYSEWPVYPDKASTEIEIGKMPGGHPLMATIIRTRIPDENNLPAAGGSGTISSNPSETETWQVQSHLVYTIGGNEYVKSRTVVRSQ